MATMYKLVKMDDNTSGSQFPTQPRGESVHSAIPSDDHYGSLSNVVSLLSPELRSKAKKVLPYIAAKVKLEKDSNRIIYRDSGVIGSPLSEILKFLLAGDSSSPKPWDSGLFMQEVGGGIPSSLLSPSSSPFSEPNRKRSKIDK